MLLGISMLLSAGSLGVMAEDTEQNVPASLQEEISDQETPQNTEEAPEPSVEEPETGEPEEAAAEETAGTTTEETDAASETAAEEPINEAQGPLGDAYVIHGVTVHNGDFSSSPNQCWVYAQNIYAELWGTSFSSSFDSSDNLLRDLSDRELTLTAEHLKAYVSAAPLGACLRICNSEYLHGSDGWGHSQIIVEKDENGFTVFQGGLSTWPYRNEQYYTWSEYASGFGREYAYIKYIQWPGAPSYVPGMAAQITISGETAPEVLEQGVRFGVSGRVESGLTLLDVTAGVYDASGELVMGSNIQPEAAGYDLAALNNTLCFQYLQPGIYEYRVTATNADHTQTLIDRWFTILATGETICPGTYALSYDGETDRQFAFVPAGEGYYTLENVSTGNCLQAYVTETGVVSFEAPPDALSDQLWQALPAGSGYCLVPKDAVRLWADQGDGMLSIQPVTLTWATKADQWRHSSERWYHYEGGEAVTGWQKIAEKWYCMDAFGALRKGWVSTGTYWFYLQEDGTMAANETRTIGGKDYTFSGWGALIR
jgi:hypothetical protein